jgi:hypothetical protein
MNEADRKAALKRLGKFADQQRDSDDLADRGSLDRAADIVALYEDRSWVKELPPPKVARNRGRPVDPESFSRFSKWLAEQTSLTGRRAYQLRDAFELAETYLNQVQIKPHGERDLRPLRWLARHNYGERISDVWNLAVELADGRTPSSRTVRRALAQWKKDNLPKGQGASSSRGGEALAERLKRDAHRLMEEYPHLFVEVINQIEAEAEEYYTVVGDDRVPVPA